MEKLNIVFCSFPDFSGNAKSLFKYMQKKYKDNVNLAWVVRDEKMFAKLKDENIEVYEYDTKEYYEYIKKADIIFTTHCNLVDDKPEHCLYIELWHGIGMKPIGYLINNITEFDKQWYLNVRKKIDYMIVPSEFWQLIFSTVFYIDARRILPIAYPKLDEINNANAKKDLTDILNTDVEKYKKVIFYMPTLTQNYTRDLEIPLNKNNLFNFSECYDEEILKRYLMENNYLLCVKLHPSEKNISVDNIENENIKIIKDDRLQECEKTVTSILNAADVLITDYSSLSVEFSFLNKPVIFLNENSEIYKKTRGIILGDTKFWESKYTANNITSLISQVSAAINNGIDDKSKSKRKLWFSDLKDGGCKNICNFLIDGEYNVKTDVQYYEDREEVLEKRIDNLEIEAQELKEKNNGNEETIEQYKQEIDNIYNSKGWQALEKMRKIKRIVSKKKN